MNSQRFSKGGEQRGSLKGTSLNNRSQLLEHHRRQIQGTLEVIGEEDAMESKGTRDVTDRQMSREKLTPECGASGLQLNGISQLLETQLILNKQLLRKLNSKTKFQNSMSPTFQSGHLTPEYEVSHPNDYLRVTLQICLQTMGKAHPEFAHSYRAVSTAGILLFKQYCRPRPRTGSVWMELVSNVYIKHDESPFLNGRHLEFELVTHMKLWWLLLLVPNYQLPYAGADNQTATSKPIGLIDNRMKINHNYDPIYIADMERRQTISDMDLIGGK
ncbi:hypothetical protein QR680_000564 [Steinernema hermaphroditum]|uniref:Uncharacterized protein n=1 Tax=Steinernema hermaphroditum TaxID=289476 RepID=A0AA39LEA3_9BILA|nr:hypothetical protein QR680_000564 [Steinernema hermaphroditum]